MSPESVNKFQFLSGSGEMATRTRQKDWAATPVGPIETWPQSLCTTISIILNSKFPMFLWWGPELTCFYNDAYRPSLGHDGKHPAILGMPAKEAWLEIWDTISPLINQVLAGGESTWSADQLIPIYRNGKIEDVYWTFSYSPVSDEEGKVTGVLVVCNETTNEVVTRRKLVDSEKHFRNTVKQAPLGITILNGKDFVPEMANLVYLELVDRKEEDFVGIPLFDSLPEVKDVVAPLLNKVLETGEPYYASELSVMLNRYGKQEPGYFNLVYHPYRDDHGQVTGIIVVATEVTESVKAKHKLAESEIQFRNMVMQSPIPMTIFRGPDHVIEMANTVMFDKIWRRKESEVVGRKALEVFPELKTQKYPELLKNVLATGKIHSELESPVLVEGNDGGKMFYLDFEYLPLFESDGAVSGIMITVNDVTERVEARKRVEDNEERLEIIINASGLGIWELDMVTNEDLLSEQCLHIFGLSEPGTQREEILKNIHPEDRAVRDAALDKAMATGILHYESRFILPDGTIRWVENKGKILYDGDKKHLKMIGTVRDITEQKNSQQVLLESELKFRLLADSMPQHIWTSGADGVLNYFNQSVFNYSGLTYEQLMKDSWLQIVHPEDREENVKQWLHSVATGEDFLFEHRFRRHDGEYRWQLSRAMPQRDAKGSIQMWVGTSTDIQDQKTFARELERQVQERTQELEKMNAELKSFAYVSSHDLQEPLRKIQTFISRILEREEQTLSESGKDSFKRIQSAAKRMQTLIEDLLTYSRTNTTERKFETADVNKLLAQVKAEMHEEILNTSALIVADDLLQIETIPFQFKQMMHNLIGNAIKFAKEGVTPDIVISAHIAMGISFNMPQLAHDKKYYHLSVQDNGIGFDNQYKDKIFEVFQRLHGKSEYKGTGIGLAIVKKIVENHAGIITASGEPDKGATFDIYIPV